MTEYAVLYAMFQRIAEEARADGRMWMAAWARVEAEKYKEMSDDDD